MKPPDQGDQGHRVNVADLNTMLVIGLGYGDCGKGSIVDFLVRSTAASTVVRFNGGPQAGHNVVTPDGRHHTFSQFGSGTFVPCVRALLSRFMFIEPYALFNEANHLHDLGITDALDRLVIDARCPVITPAHQAANRLRELARHSNPHGTCGVGLGEAMSDLLHSSKTNILRAGDLADSSKVAACLDAVRRLKLNELSEAIVLAKADPRSHFCIETLNNPNWIPTAVETYANLSRHAIIADESAVTEILRQDRPLVFEGAQGVLLDESFGFHPHTTWSDTTFANALTLLSESGRAGPITRIGILRTYITRHGAGPLVTEDDRLRASLPEPHNTDVGWAGRFRVGCFDAVAARYAIEAAGGVDMLALTHLDCLPALPPIYCDAYRAPSGALINRLPLRRAIDPMLTQMLLNCQPVYSALVTSDPNAFMDQLTRTLDAPIGITSFGPSAHFKRI